MYWRTFSILRSSTLRRSPLCGMVTVKARESGKGWLIGHYRLLNGVLVCVMSSCRAVAKSCLLFVEPLFVLEVRPAMMLPSWISK